MTTTTTGRLPYFDGDADSYQEAIADRARQAEQRWKTLTDRLIDNRHRNIDPPLSPAEVEDMDLARTAALHAWSTVALLGLIRQHHGGEWSHRAAAMVDDMSVNGGVPYYADEESR